MKVYWNRETLFNLELLKFIEVKDKKCTTFDEENGELLIEVLEPDMLLIHMSHESEGTFTATKEDEIDIHENIYKYFVEYLYDDDDQYKNYEGFANYCLLKVPNFVK